TATITVNALPTITGTLNVCIGLTTQLTGSSTAATTNPWVSSNPLVATINNSGLVAGVSAGTTTITYANSTGCRTTLIITVNSTTPAPTGSTSQTLCSGSTVANLTATGTNIKWYSTSNGGTALASTTALINGTTYYASQTVNGCESTTRLAVIVSLNNPTVSASVTTVCSGQPTTLTASDGNIQQPLSNKIAQFSNNISNTIALNYPSPVPTSNFSYDFWFNTSRTITLLSEKTGGVSVQAINGQNFVVFPSQPRGSGISVGTNGISVIEHSPYFFDSRFTQQINLTGWHHCAVVYTGNNFSLYIDGVLIGTRNNGSNFGGFGNTYSNVTLTQSIGEGYPGYDANDNYTGKIDEFRQWNVSLTVNQVQQIFNRKLLSNNMSECNVNLTFDQNNITNSSNIISAVSITNSNLPTFSTDNSFLIGGFVGSSIVSIINTNFSGTSSTSYLWSTGATTASISVNPTSTTQYWVDVTTNGVTCRKNITITVNSTTPAPTGSASQTLCSGSTVANLTATGTNIKWYATSTGGTALAATTALVNGTTYYASQTVNDCESGTRLVVTVSLNATATIALTSGYESEFSSGCYFSDDIVYTIGNGATGVNVYSQFPNWITTTTIGTTVTISFNNSDTPPPGLWYFEISTTGGCGNATRTFTRGINGISSVELRSPPGTDNQTICINDPIQDVRYAVTTVLGFTGFTYIYAEAFGLPAGVTLSRDYSTNEIIFSGTPTEAGVFNYFIYNGICGGPTFYGGTITVNSSPAPTGPNNQTMTQGSTLANLVVTGQNIVWYSTPFEGTPLTLNTPLVNGTTYFASQTINGCESQDRLPVIVQFTLNNNEFDTINIVYNPNPVIDILYIKASTELKNAKICNVLGQTIFQQRFNSNEIQLNMSDFTTGTYFVIVESDERKETFKILKK
uniref:Ig-like domain-containing protein n=1 Tax=Flavobacterium sp. TaxID=239 RepID=UPI0037BF6537